MKPENHHDAVIDLEPQPRPDELPPRLWSPFDAGEPHPLARRAADELQALLRGGRAATGVDLGGLAEPGRGKMFGVLVVAAASGRVGYLRGFSGMLDGRWHVDGFAPPLFDARARDAVWPAGEAELRALDDRHRELDEGAGPVGLRAALAELHARHQAESAALHARHAERRARRHQQRALRASAPDDPAAAREQEALQEALHLEGRADALERQRLDRTHEAEREQVAAPLRALAAQRRELEQVRAARSRELLVQIYDTYVIPNARGERRSLWSLFAPEAPPGGAGDCAAPKLLAQAYRLGLRPLALAELWWGASPLTGGRDHGHFYPACRRKCGGILPFMLQGVDVDGDLDAATIAGPDAIAADAPRVVYEDEWLLAVDKPSGLAAAPDRHDPGRDSVLRRLEQRAPGRPAPLLVDRPDTETSGLVLLARDRETYAALQRQLARRELELRHVAWLEGVVAGDQGVIELPLRVDAQRRPRRMHDPVGGKRAVTGWRVLARTDTRTQVVLVPHTARTHQLRVHAAHPLGLGAPIVGDALYGRGGPRLLLHADALAFVHPRTGRRVELVLPARF